MLDPSRPFCPSPTTYLLYDFHCRNDFKLVFGVDIQTPLSKADRLLYGESSLTHAMVFTAVSLDVSNFFKEYFFHQNLYKFTEIKIFDRKTVNRPNSVWKIHGVKMPVKKDTL